MRPIKFRGRDIETGKFVSAELGQVSAEINDKYLTFITDDVHLVDADSIAQLVGYDANGREVYEGDVLVDDNGCKMPAMLFALQFSGKVKEAQS